MNVDGINVLVLVTAVGRTATVEVAPDRAPITFGIATLIANILVFFLLKKLIFTANQCFLLPFYCS